MCFIFINFELSNKTWCKVQSKVSKNQDQKFVSLGLQETQCCCFPHIRGTSLCKHQILVMEVYLKQCACRHHWWCLRIIRAGKEKGGENVNEVVVNKRFNFSRDNLLIQQKVFSLLDYRASNECSLLLLVNYIKNNDAYYSNINYGHDNVVHLLHPQQDTCSPSIQFSQDSYRAKHSFTNCDRSIPHFSRQEKQDRQYTYIVALRPIHITIFCGKTVSITCSECVSGLSYPACKTHALYFIVIGCLSGCTKFFTLSH